MAEKEYIEREAVLALAEDYEEAIDDGADEIFFEYIPVYKVRSLPAADVRPVVRGKWIEHYEPYSTGEEWIEAQYGYECSICGRWEYEKQPFCNCGADMREEN